MRVVSLNLDLVDATTLRDVIAQHLAGQQPDCGIAGVDGHLHSLQLTLTELTRMIDRPAPRRCWPTMPRHEPPHLRLVGEPAAEPGR